MRQDVVRRGLGFDRYRELIAQTPVPLELRFEGEVEGFRARIDSGQVGSVSIATLSSVAAGRYEVCRTPALIRRSDPEDYRLLLNLSGRGVLVHHGREAALSPGDLVLYDTSHPFTGWRGVDADVSRWVMIAFPKAQLPAPPGQINKLLGALLPGHDTVATLVAACMAQISRDVGRYQPAEAFRLSTVLLDLVSVLVTRTTGSGDRAWPEDSQQALLLAVQNFIEQHLGDPDLDPVMIAAAHHISVRSLHRLFGSEHLTVAGWIRNRRLDRCRQDLTDLRLRHRQVHAIGARWGLTNPAHFSRVFKAAFGLTPSDYRARRSETGDPDLARIVKQSARNDTPARTAVGRLHLGGRR